MTDPRLLTVLHVVTRLSLRLRLILAGAMAVGIALAVSWVGLGLLFATHVERRAQAELSVHLDQIVSGVTRTADGALVLPSPPPDPRFDLPLGGRYWQVRTDGALLRSRSLWDQALSVDPSQISIGRPSLLHQEGLSDRELLILAGAFRLPSRLGGTEIIAAVALDRRELFDAQEAFQQELAPYLVGLALILIAAGAAQVMIGLSPLGRLGRRVEALRRGQEVRMGKDWPTEVRALALEIDALLDAQASELSRARTRAGDLAHGLKTPLQAILGEADRLRRSGDTGKAASLEAVVTTMQRHVDRELSRSRTALAGTTDARTDIARAIRQILKVLERTPDGARCTWTLDVEGAGFARLEEADTAEALGALMENAARHARHAITVRAANRGALSVITIQDDGPGIPAEDRPRLLARGGRLDESGTGLGFAIATDIIAAAGGGLVLDDARPGLVLTVTVPAASP